MATKLTLRLSKEFQIKVREEAVISDDHCIETVMDILEGIEESGRFDFKLKRKSGRRWERRGERYDTLPTIGLFKSNNVTLATEKRGEGDDARTKLKCKLHNFVPELLYETVESAWSVPAPGDYGDEVEPKFKLEQDIHFTNCKTCATGYLTLPGRDHEFSKVKEFLPYYPNLLKIPGTKRSQHLVKVKDWNETVFDDIEMSIGDWAIRGALVTRRDFLTGAWDESEFSFKIERALGDEEDPMEPAAGWDYQKLRELAAIYNELYRIDSIFIRAPSIFTFADPVSSTKIRVVD